MKSPLRPTWFASRRGLILRLALVLWLVPQLLLANHGHWAQHNAAPDCEICQQLTTSTPVLDSPLALSPVPLAAVAHEFQICSRAFSRANAVCCRGPPRLPHVLT